MQLINLTLPIGVSLLFGIAIVIAIRAYFSARQREIISRLEAITEPVTNIPIQAFDKEGTIFLWNRASELNYGYLRKDAIGKKIQDLILIESEKESFLNDTHKIFESCKALSPRQWVITTRSGQKRTMYSTMFPDLKHGKCQSVFCFDVDITDIIKQHEQTKDSREDYKAIFNGIEEAIYVVDPNDDKILFANIKGCKQIGYTEEELEKLSIGDLSFGDKFKVQERVKDLSSRTFYEGPQHFEWKSLKKNGEAFDVEVDLKKDFIAKRDCILAVVRDVSQKKKTERQLHEVERRHKELLKHSNSLIFYLDKKGIVTSANEAVKKIFGFAIEEVIGKHFLTFLCEEDHQKGQDVFRKVISGEQVNNVEFKGSAKGNKEISIQINIWPEYNEDNEIVGMHGDAIDITDQKIMLDKMREMVVQIISMLSETVSVADRYTEKHCERLQELSLKIGAKLDLEEKQLEHLKFAALLHDVGKVGVPIHILIKKGKLTDEEWQKIKEHPKKGADIVRQLSGFEEVAQIIEQHQERFDGKGYPRGLSEDQIKKEAAIISVVDAFDAMTSDRPYRKAMSIKEAVEELRKNAGTQFDPKVVEAFIGIIQSEPEAEIL